LQAEAAALVASAEEGGELFDAMDAAYASWRKAMEEEEEEINEDDDDEEEGDMDDESEEDEDSDDDFAWAEQVPWKGEEGEE